MAEVGTTLGDDLVLICNRFIYFGHLLLHQGAFHPVLLCFLRLEVEEVCVLVLVHLVVDWLGLWHLVHLGRHALRVYLLLVRVVQLAERLLAFLHLTWS